MNIKGNVFLEGRGFIIGGEEEEDVTLSYPTFYVFFYLSDDFNER